MDSASSETSRDTALPFARIGNRLDAAATSASSASAPRRVTGNKTRRVPSRLASPPTRRVLSSHPASFSASLHRFACAVSTANTAVSPRNEWPPPSPGPGRPGVVAPVVSYVSALFSASLFSASLFSARSAANAAAIRSRSRSARAAFAAHFSLAIATSTFMASSETSRVPLATSGASIRIEHRAEHTARPVPPATTPLSRKPASRASRANRLPASTLSASTAKMNGSKRSTSEVSGSGVEDDDAASVPSPSLRRTAETTAAASAGSWLTYTHSPPFIPAARVSAVGSANRETRPAQELVVKKAGCVFTSATTARARASTWPARERSPASSASSARVDALRCAKASIVTDAGDQRRERPHRARLRVVGDVYCDDAGPRTEVAKRVPSRTFVATKEKHSSAEYAHPRTFP